mmetsp:Transcript_3505/g.4708  ORF Transcript_3505/g.4708 Transcript_3505/m.4708 type:complete len:257 (-) Transcript_3505:17-787(-)
MASSRYEEDLHPHGHNAVWGSWFDASAQKWGYSCCKATQRDAPGCLASLSEVDSEFGGNQTTRHSRGLPGIAAQEAADVWKPREDFVIPEDFVSYAARHFVHRWRSWLTDGSLQAASGSLSAESSKVLLSQASLTEATRLLEIFCRRVRDGKVPKELLEKLEAFCSQVGDRQYLQANKVYMDIVMGTRKWQGDVPYLVEGNRNGPSVVQNVAERINKSNANPLDVAGLRDHTVLLRRLMSVSQAVMPNSDPSLNSG